MHLALETTGRFISRTIAASTLAPPAAGDTTSRTVPSGCRQAASAISNSNPSLPWTRSISSVIALSARLLAWLPTLWTTSNSR
jgi:hypothetical protein